MAENNRDNEKEHFGIGQMYLTELIDTDYAKRRIYYRPCLFTAVLRGRVSLQGAE